VRHGGRDRKKETKKDAEIEEDQKKLTPKLGRRALMLATGGKGQRKLCRATGKKIREANDPSQSSGQRCKEGENTGRVKRAAEPAKTTTFVNV